MRKILLQILFINLIFFNSGFRQVLADQQVDYIDLSSLEINLTESEKNWLQEHNDIRLGVDPNWEPFEFFDKKNGSYRGMAAEYISLINQFLSTDMKPKGKFSWPQVIQQAKDKEIDVLPCVVKTPQREKYLNFTEPYLHFPMVILMRHNATFINGLENLKGARIGVVKTYASYEFISKNHPDIPLVEINNIAEGLTLLSEGKLDAFVDNLATVTSAMQTMGITNLKVAAQTLYSFDLSIGVRKDWPELVTILNKVLAAIPEQMKNKIRSNWIAVRFDQGLDVPNVLKISIIIALVVLTVFSIILYSNRKLYAEIKRRIQVEKELELLVDTDPLTGLYNRRYFNQQFRKEFSRARRNNYLFAYVMMDLDYFKEYNDIYGHQEGDKALRKISQLFSHLFKRAGDDCFRLGGEEFGALLIHMTKEQIQTHLETVRKSVEELKIEHSGNHSSNYLTLSIGYVLVEPPHRTTLDDIYKMADMALYLAKEKGRNKVATYNPIEKMIESNSEKPDTIISKK